MYLLHSSILKKLTKINKTTYCSSYTSNKYEFTLPTSLNPTLKHGMNCAAFIKIPANWLKEKHHKSKVFHEVKFYLCLRQSYFITKEIFFETIATTSQS